MLLNELSELVFRLTESAIETRHDDHQLAQIKILKGSINFDAAWWGWSNFHGGKSRLINTGLYGLPPSFESAVRAGLHADPLVKVGRNLAVFGKVLSTADKDLPDDFRNLLEAYQIKSVLSGHCRLQGETSFNFFLSLYIKSNDQTFSENEADSYRLVLRHIEQNLSLSLRAELRSQAPSNGEAAFVSVGGGIIRATREFSRHLIDEGLRANEISEILAGLTFDTGYWVGSKISMESSSYRRDMVLIRQAPIDALGKLSRAERGVAEQMGKGFSMREIAAQKAVSHNTVRNQVSSIYRKIGVNNRTMLLNMLRDTQT